MPTVPRSKQSTVEPARLPNVKAPTDLPIASFGGGRSFDRVIDAGQNLVDTGLSIYEAEKRKADEIAIRDADIATAELSSQLETGVKQLKGKDAAKAPDYIEENWNKGMDKLLPTLKDDNQREAAQRIIRARRLQLNESANLHMAGEFKRYDEQQFQSAINLYRNEGSMKYNRPGAIPNSIFQQETEIDRFAARNSLPPEWANEQKAKARSATYRDVLERMEVDGNHDMAKQYEKGINKFILPDDVAILDKVRKEEKARKEEMQSAYERGVYLLLADNTSPDSEKLDALDRRFRSGDMTVAQYEKFKGWVLNTFDEKEIPIEKKVSKHQDLVKSFMELDGVKVDSEGRPTSAAEGNDFKAISAFRKKVAEAKPYLSQPQYEQFITLTEADYDESRAPKKNIFQSLLNILPSLPALSPAQELSIVTRGMAIFNKSMTPQQAADQTLKLKEEAVVSGNPKRSKYYQGQRVTNPQGIDLEVVGFDESGNPRFKVLG